MPLHLAQRLHAFTSSLGRSSEAQETLALFNQVSEQLGGLDLLYESGRINLLNRLVDRILEGMGIDTEHPQREPITQLVGDMLIHEELFVLPDFKTDRNYTTAQYWEIRKNLNKQKRLVDAFDETLETLRLYFSHSLDAVYTASPQLLERSKTGDITIPTQLPFMIANLGQVIEDIAQFTHAEELKAHELLSSTHAKLEYNLIIASGGNPADPHGFNRIPKMPSRSDIQNPKELIKTYLERTALFDFFRQKVGFTIPTAKRFEHHHILAGSGHGKTQTLQYLITHDLEAVANGERSIVVIDSQGDLINNISRLSVFGEGGALHDRVVIIDPTDVEYPVSLNLFDVGQERLGSYAPLERERLTNSILELYDFVLGSLLDAQMTQKQNVIFRYVTRLMMTIPGATIHTLRELMEEGSEEKFQPYFDQLSGSAKHFFQTEFHSREFSATRRQVLRRLWGILENSTFERMFSHPKSRLDLFYEMNAGKVILINTAKDLLKETGTEIFGRFFIALIAQAAQERATLSPRDRTPTFVYIDEAADYFDRNIGIILSQARKYNIGMILAHQYLGQLEPRLQEAFAANTTIKMAGGVSSKDARALAPSMHTDPDSIERQNKGTFATHIRGQTQQAVPLQFPFGVMEDLPRLTPEQRHILQQKMRTRYATHYSELEKDEQDTENKPSPDSTIDPNEPTKGW